MPLVPETGVEPARLAALDPKSSVSANFTTPARVWFLVVLRRRRPEPRLLGDCLSPRLTTRSF